MTVSDWRKTFKQLKIKPAKLKKYIKHNKPKERKTGLSLNKCSNCGRTMGYINKYGIKMCRHCFREQAVKIGFKKFS